MIEAFVNKFMWTSINVHIIWYVPLLHLYTRLPPNGISCGVMFPHIQVCRPCILLSLNSKEEEKEEDGEEEGEEEEEKVMDKGTGEKEE